MGPADRVLLTSLRQVRAVRALALRVPEGALVGQGDATLLTTVQQIVPIYLTFTQSST